MKVKESDHSAQEISFQEIKYFFSVIPCLSFSRDDSFELFTQGSVITADAALCQSKNKDSNDLVSIGKWSPTQTEYYLP